jgi:putative zinc finger protein
LSGSADNDKSFEHILASFLREDLGSSRKDCPHPGLLSAYFEGKLAEPEARELEIHLSSCSGCQAEIAALLRLQPETAPEAVQPKPVEPTPPAAVVKAEPPPEAEKVMPPSQPAVGATPFTPKRRRALATWVGPVALAASAVLAIGVTYRFAPLIGEASRRSRESELRVRAPENAVPLAASRDADAQTKQGLEVPQAATPLMTAASPGAPPILDKMPAAESRSALPESMAREKTDTLARAPTVTVQQAPGAPTLEPASPPAMAPREGANEPSETKQAAKDERTLEAFRADQAAPAPAGEANVGVAATATKPTTDRGVVIVARTSRDVAWRLSDATIERSDDAGKTWRAQSTGDATGLLAGSAPSDEICWLAGRGGLVLRTTDGEHWQRLVPPTTSDLTQIRARDAKSATVRTARGERFSTEDGGQSWSTL